jgi:hypothetical protein
VTSAGSNISIPGTHKGRSESTNFRVSGPRVRLGSAGPVRAHTAILMAECWEQGHSQI